MLPEHERFRDEDSQICSMIWAQSSASPQRGKYAFEYQVTYEH